MTDGLIDPIPSKRLYAAVFEGKPPRSIAENVADGIRTLIGNVERMLSDVDYLRADGRIASASFLLATADEEFAKVSILVDACRLNAEKYSSTLHSLCRAFYDHISKHAYNTVRRYRPSSMADISKLWYLATRRWIPEPPCPESGEPAMPHETFFDREMPLYVDWDYNSGEWVPPDNGMNEWKFKSDAGTSHLERLRSELTDLKVAGEAKLLSAEALTILNDVWSGAYVNDKTPTTDVERLDRRLINRLVAEVKGSEENLLRSLLLNWPLYHFTNIRSSPY